jgi:hypothetical protein
MNTLMLVVLAVVLLCYCGGKYCPKVLSSNKEMLLGVLVGLVLCSFAGLKLEGMTDELPRVCCTDMSQPECSKFIPSGTGGVTIQDLANRCREQENQQNVVSKIKN